MDDQDNKLPLKRKVGAFIVTLIAIPVLFIGTCVPVGFMAMAFNRDMVTPVVVFTIYGIAFVGAGLWRATVTKNAGERWAIIVALVAALIWFGFWFVLNQFGSMR